VLVGEDCSTDATRDVLGRLEKEFPQRLQVAYNETNVGLFENYRRLLARCTGEYVAFLEGDDYWIGTDKLRKQVNYLDTHPDAAACFHDTLVFQDDGSGEELFQRGARKEKYDVLDMLEDLLLHSSSLVTRRSAIQGIFDHRGGGGGGVIGDWPLFIYIAKSGYLGRIDGVMSAHRKHPLGVWNRASAHERVQDVMKIFDLANALFEGRHDRFIQAMKRHWQMHLMAEDRIHRLERQLAAALVQSGQQDSNRRPPDPKAGPAGVVT
jgi:glycosyltransferase involved in cell wall biosynthesis